MKTNAETGINLTHRLTNENVFSRLLLAFSLLALRPRSARSSSRSFEQKTHSFSHRNWLKLRPHPSRGMPKRMRDEETCH